LISQRRQNTKNPRQIGQRSGSRSSEILEKFSARFRISYFICLALFVGGFCCSTAQSALVSPAPLNPGLASPPPPPASQQCVWTGVEKIVTIGDLHGDYDHFIRVLKGTKIVDSDLHWTGGKAHLVQMGDVMDRGDQARKIFDLIRQLDKEARAAGGMVHQLIGNHEELNIIGEAIKNPEYVTPSQFQDYLSPDYKEKIEAEFKRKNKNGDDDELWKNLMSDPEAQKNYTETFLLLDGRWLAEQNVIIKINDTVFVHGGLNLEYAIKGLTWINKQYRSEFQKIFKSEALPRQRITFAPESPLWNRDLPTAKDSYEEEVDKILAALGAKRIIIAHTPSIPASRETIERDIKKFGGKVWISDTGIAAIYHGYLTALIIDENGRLTVGVY